MNNEIKEINIKMPGQILDYVDTKEHLLELFNYITNLQEENEHLDKVNCQLRKKINNDIYKQRIDKAIEWVKKNMYYFPRPDELLNILRGDE